VRCAGDGWRRVASTGREGGRESGGAGGRAGGESERRSRVSCAGIFPCTLDVHARSSVRPRLQASRCCLSVPSVCDPLCIGGGEGRGGEGRGSGRATAGTDGGCGTMKGTRAIFLRERRTCTRVHASRASQSHARCARDALLPALRPPSSPRPRCERGGGRGIRDPTAPAPVVNIARTLARRPWKDPLLVVPRRERRREEICVITTRTGLHYQAASRGSFVPKKRKKKRHGRGISSSRYQIRKA